MSRFFSCALNGEELCDSGLYIEDIREKAEMSVQTADSASYGQQLLSAPGHDAIKVLIRIMIKERDPIMRQHIIDRVNEWSGEGWLTINTRPGKRLYAVCTQPVSIETLKWSERMEIEFTAFDHAYWQDEIPVKAELTSSNGSVAIHPFGTKECFLEAQITNRSGRPINSLTISANGDCFNLEDLALANGKTLSIRYDEHHWLCMENDSVPCLGCRTGLSSDHILLYPKKDNTIQFVADGECSCTFFARGIYQ